jgi:hypothetical protein
MAMASRIVAATVAVMAVMALAAIPAGAGAGAAEAGPCERSREADFLYGLPAGWEVQTSQNTDGGPVWERSDDPIARGWRAWSVLTGAGVKDDALLSLPLTVTERTRITFSHDLALGPNAGGTLETSADGVSWTPVPAEHISGDRPSSVSGGDAAAWSGAHIDDFLGSQLESTADLSYLAGSTVRLAWRLRASGPGTPGYWWCRRSRWPTSPTPAVWTARSPSSGVRGRSSRLSPPASRRDGPPTTP